MPEMKDIVKLAVDAHHGKIEKYSQEQSMEVLREALIDANGGSTTLNYKNIRDGKCNGLFALVEEILARTVVEGIQEDDFFNTLVDFRNISLGDQNVFDVEDDDLFFVAEIAEGTQGVRRQRIAGVSQTPINTSLHAVKIYEELNRKDSLNIRFLAPQNHIEMWFDKEVITIIVDNLVSNAIKYTEKGEVTITIDQKDKDVNISVADTGYGIAPEALSHLFERYYQAGGEHQVSGTGIGLSLVKSLVELHHASIKVNSTTGEGTCFSISLQADYNYPDDLHAEPQKSESPKQLIDMSETGIENSEMPTMLVVEDNKDIRDYIEESFSDQFAIHTASDGKEGLTMAQQILPDIIISDVMMPNMNGNQMCRTLKNDLNTSHIPIILLTAKEEGYDSGADSYITKPFSHSLLASRIKNLLKQRQRLSSVLTASAVQNDQTEKQAILKESLSKIDQDFYNTLNQYIDERISSEIDVNYLAEKLCMSTSTLYRKMKSLTGLSTIEYIRKYKMQYAERLMMEGKYTISEVAYMSGFNSINYFRRCFKEEFGDVPSDYLKKLKR